MKEYEGIKLLKYELLSIRLNSLKEKKEDPFFWYVTLSKSV